MMGFGIEESGRHHYLESYDAVSATGYVFLVMGLLLGQAYRRAFHSQPAGLSLCQADRVTKVTSKPATTVFVINQALRRTASRLARRIGNK